MAITYNSIDIRGKAAEPIVEELLFENKTVSEGLVTFETDVKAETIFTEPSADAIMQAFDCGIPTSQGDLGGFDALVTPVKVMYYQEFCPDTLRFSRYKRDMAAGAWNNLSGEFERVVIGGVYAGTLSQDLERKFWSNVTSATKTAVAALTAGTGATQVSAAEKALVAATTTGLFDGVVQKMIYNASNETQTAGVGGRIKVVGTAITAANIKAEYDKLYAAIPAVVLASGELPYIYAPHSHKQLINIYNNNPENFKNAFDVQGDSYRFNGIEIKFVPVPENVMIAAKKAHIVWATDLESDFSTIKIDRVANNSEEYFLKSILTMAAHVQKQAFNVLYVG